MVKIVQIDWKKENATGKLDEKSVLRQESKVVKKEEFGTLELKKIISDMQEAMEKEEDGVAIAAPQIGVAKRIFCIKEKAYELEGKETKWRPLVFINPKIKKASKKMLAADEGCLSVRPLYGTTFRHTNITLEAQDLNGVNLLSEPADLLLTFFNTSVNIWMAYFLSITQKIYKKLIWKN